MTESAEPPARAWRLVLEHIEADLLEGRLAPGDRLPAERELATRLGVGRSSVREALRVLEVMGLLRTATGSGPQAGAIIVAAPDGGLGTLLRLQVAAQSFPIGDVVRTRLLIEEAVVTAVALREDRDLEPARRILAAMNDQTLSAEEFLALDAQFHLALAVASGNQVVTAIMAGLRESIETYVREGAARIRNWPALAARLRSEHREIVAAVSDGDPERARALVHDHITGYYDRSRAERD